MGVQGRKMNQKKATRNENRWKKAVNAFRQGHRDESCLSCSVITALEPGMTVDEATALLEHYKGFCVHGVFDKVKRAVLIESMRDKPPLRVTNDGTVVTA